jgi:uncharacterized membrane protein
MYLVNARNRGIAKTIIKKSPELFSDEEKQMLVNSPSLFIPAIELYTAFARFEFASAIGGITWVTLIYGVVCIFIHSWISLLLCICIFLYSWLGPLGNAFETHSLEENTKRAISRYLRANIKRDRKVNKILGIDTDVELSSRPFHNKYINLYNEVLAKLDDWSKQSK